MTTISEAAQAAGIGVETIRFYERKALIRKPPRPASGGARDYGGATLERLGFIVGAKRLGFSLAEIAELLALRAAPDTECLSFRERARTKRAEVQARIEGLARVREALDALIDACPGQGALSGCAILGAIEADGAGLGPGPAPSGSARR